MTESLFLSEEDLRDLTGFKRSSAQATALSHMGFEFKRRPDASVVVLRAHVEKELGLTVDKSKKPRVVKPNWDALNKKT